MLAPAGYQRSEDPLTCPRWTFQALTTAAMMVLVEDSQAGILQALADTPADAEICTWMGLAHDLPLMISGCMRHGPSLSQCWHWLANGGFHKESYLDRARACTAGLRMKPILLAGIFAAMDIPGKLTCPPFPVTSLIHAGRWDDVQSACEVDMISAALLLARWRRLTDPRAEADVVEDRIRRRVIELREGRGYIAALEEHRQRRFVTKFTPAANDAATLAPWLEQDAA